MPCCLEGRPFARRSSQPSAYLRDRQRAAAPRQWAGGRGWLRRKEALPLLPSRSPHPAPAPARTPARVTQRHRTPRAPRRRQRHAKASGLFLISTYGVRGCRTAWLLQIPLLPPRAPQDTLCPTLWGPPKSHVHKQTSGLTQTHTL